MNVLPLVYFNGTLRQIYPGENPIAPWPLVRNFVQSTEELTVPSRFTLTVPGPFELDGKLEIQLGGKVLIT